MLSLIVLLLCASCAPLGLASAFTCYSCSDLNVVLGEYGCPFIFFPSGVPTCEGASCRQDIIPVNGVTMYIRYCSNTTVSTAICQKTPRIPTTNPQKPIMPSTYCACNTDFCNSAPRRTSSTSVWTRHLLIAVLVMGALLGDCFSIRQLWLLYNIRINVYSCKFVAKTFSCNFFVQFKMLPIFYITYLKSLWCTRISTDFNGHWKSCLNRLIELVCGTQLGWHEQ